uniref:Metal transporter cnnm2 n=1 Tax=Echinococcus granulosus TaxID=6210 RepID=A0A068W7U7_ECHGR|nr:metal transporter cnnm2 [Echinococcus granulosus]
MLKCVKIRASLIVLTIISVVVSSENPTVTGVIPSEFISLSAGVIEVPPNKNITLYIYGESFENVTYLAFATSRSEDSFSCENHRATIAFIVQKPTVYSLETSVLLRQLTPFESAFYICFKLAHPFSHNNQTVSWIHATPTYPAAIVTLRTASTIMPLWVQIILIIILFSLSGLFSGLNLGLMALDKTELKIIETAGDPDEKRYAKAIRPVREKGNLLLCTILLGNVTVNTSLTILMDNLTGSGLFAVIASTLGITMFGEILPQAICSRHGLAIGAKTIWLTRFFMVVTFPLAFPISYVLDKMLGEDLGQVYSKEKLGVLLKEQQDAGLVAPDEMNIIAGVLNMSTKTVKDIMTQLSDAFMLPSTALLDFDTMNEIFSHGFTRIPMYEGDRRNIKAILNVKDLGFINADDKVPVATVCNFYNRSILVVPETTSLEAMLKEFRQGKTHMAFVERITPNGVGDPFQELVGLVTLEDVIEEIIQAEIVDETDIFTDNTRKQPRLVRKTDFRVFNTSNSNKPRHHLSPQLKIAALRHLASNVDAFKDEYVALSVLQSMLNSNVVINQVFNSHDENENIIYKANQWANYAVLILQGRALVETSNEKLLFEAGPFMLFGETVFKYVNDIYPEVSTLKDPELQSAQLAARARFLPDYTVRAATNIEYLRITAEHYLLARRLTVWITKLHPQGLAALEPRDESSTDADTTSLKRSALLAFRGRKDSCCVSALQGESQDFFQTAWDRHISHLREATRASVLASIVDIGGSGNSSAARPNSRSTTSPAVVVPHSVIDGTAFNDSSCDSYPASPHANSPRQKNEGLMRVEVTSPRRPLRFSMPTKYSQTPAVLQVDSTTERKTEEASDHGRLKTNPVQDVKSRNKLPTNNTTFTNRDKGPQSYIRT